MGRLFSLDNPFMQFLSKMFDLIVLNLIFILSCIPIITIGASMSALHYVCLKMLRGEDPYIWKDFWKSFRQNFKQGTFLWLISLAVIAFLGMDYYIVNSQDTTLFAVVRVALWVLSVCLFTVFVYVFPVISHFVCTTKQAVKNAVFMAIGHLPYTLIILVIFGIILFLCTYSITTFGLVVIVSGICGFSSIAFTNCIFYNLIFKKYED